jgi:lipopolysaccharide biosynthesis glycosyltransferase
MKMNVIYTADRNYRHHLFASIVSFLNYHASIEVKFYVINSDFISSDFDKINKKIKNQNAQVIDFKINDHGLEKLKLSCHFKVYNYYRLFIPSLPIDFGLYLDADTIINGSLEELYKTDLKQYIIGAVKDPAYHDLSLLDLPLDAGCFNSGMMLCNIDYWRQNDVSNLVIEFVKTNPDKILYADQCGLNYILKNKWLPLEAKFNFQLNVKHETSESPLIIHYNGHRKPWQVIYFNGYRLYYWFFRLKYLLK